MRNCYLEPRGCEVPSRGKKPPVAHVPPRWASSAPSPAGRGPRGRQHAQRPASLRRPQVVELSISSNLGFHVVGQTAKATLAGSTAVTVLRSADLRREKNYSRRPVSAQCAGSGCGSRRDGSGLGRRRSRRRFSLRTREDWQCDYDDDDNDAHSVYSGCTAVSSAPSHACSEPVQFVRGGGWDERNRLPPSPNRGAASAASAASRRPTHAGTSGALPAGVAKVQAMVRKLRESRRAVISNLQPHNSGFRELSLHLRQSSVDPVLAWTSERDCPHTATLEHSCASESVSPTCQDSSETWESLFEGIVSMNGKEEEEREAEEEVEEEKRPATMETITNTPWKENLDEDHGGFRYGSNYTRRTSQILNYYVGKDHAPDTPNAPNAPDNSIDGRPDRSQQKVSRSVPSQASFSMPVYSQMGSHPKHLRRSTVPAPRKSGEVTDSKSSLNGRVFMGKRIYPPQKIVPTYRPKLVLRQGRSFVQIHQPITLMPRSQTADYSLRTSSVTSNSCDEESADEYEMQPMEMRIDRDMSNLRIVGKSLSPEKKGIHLDGLDRLVPAGFGTSPYRDSSRCFPPMSMDRQNQMQTISPPYSSHVSSQYLSAAAVVSASATAAGISKVAVTGLENLCVYNYVNPTPRHTGLGDPLFATPTEYVAGNPAMNSFPADVTITDNSVLGVTDVQHYLDTSQVQEDDDDTIDEVALSMKVNDATVVESCSADGDPNLWFSTTPGEGEEHLDPDAVFDEAVIGEEELLMYAEVESNVSRHVDAFEAEEETEEEAVEEREGNLANEENEREEGKGGEDLEYVEEEEEEEEEGRYGNYCDDADDEDDR